MSDQRLFVLGATGGTGQLVVTGALGQGFEVTAFVRDPTRLRTRSERLRVRVGDITGDESLLKSAMDGQDAVISLIGVGNSFKSGGIIEQATPRILRSMTASGVRRLVFTSAFGVGETRRDVPAIPRLFMRTLLRDVYQDKEAGEQALRRSQVDWTIVYPARLVDRPATGRYRVGQRLQLSGFPSIGRADLAEFLLGQVNDTRYVRTGVLISS